MHVTFGLSYGAFLDISYAINVSLLFHPEYPLTQSKSTYLNASSSIRDHRARVVTVKVFINDLVGPEADPQQSRHFEDKLIRLVGPGRYDPNDHSITIVADSCPYSFQV